MCKPDQLKCALNKFGNKKRPSIRPTDCVGGLRESVSDYICSVHLPDINGRQQEHIFEFVDKEKQVC